MRRLMAVIVAAVLFMTVAPGIATAQPTITPGWLSSNESYGCGQSTGTRPPHASVSGWVSDSQEILGPYGELYGRTVGEIRSRLVRWEVPGSGGYEVYVHELALPAFLQVTEGLAAKAAEGLVYEVRPQHTYGFAPRTVSGSLRLSHHTFGITVDINSTTNPYRGDNVLITDMPDWWVQVWRDAGFCWGGDWQSIKDPMHLAWKGPAASGYDTYGPLLAPGSPAANHTTALFEGPTALGAPDEGESFMFGDLNRDGAPDVVRITPQGDGVHLDVVRSSRGFGACSTIEWWAPRPDAEEQTHMMADYDRDGRPDLWSFDESGTFVVARISTYRDDYLETITVPTKARPSAGMSYAVGDWDRDGITDLLVFRRGGPGTNTVVEVWPGSFDYVSRYAPFSLRVRGAIEARWSFDLEDLDRDGVLEILAAEDGIGGGDGVRVLVFSADDGFYSPSALLPAIPAGNTAIGIVDYDGDSRRDVAALADDGTLRIMAGGATTGDPTRWFQSPDWECAADGEPFGPAAERDVTGDGIADAIDFDVAAGSWTVGESTGGEFVFAPWADLENDLSWSDWIHGDFDGDGREDVATLQTGVNLWWVGESKGDFFEMSVWADFLDDNVWGSLLAGDFDGDGKDDIVGYRETTDDWWVGLSQGDGFFATRWAFGNTPDRPADLVGDVDGDARDDLLWFDAVGSDWWVARSTGTSFEVERWANYTNGTVWDAFVGGDFDGDGRFDVASFLSGANSWWVSRSTGSGFATSRWADYTNGIAWDGQVAGDFDGDGLTDIANVQAANGRIWISRSTGSKFATSSWGIDAGLAGDIEVVRADFTGDGLADLGRVVDGAWTVYRSTGTSFATEYWGSPLD